MPPNIYYVYLKWGRPDNNLRADWGRWLMTFESRQKADEFYRYCRNLKNPDGKNRFTLLNRSTAQFWVYDTTEGDAYFAPQRICENDVNLNFYVMPVLLNDVGGRDWPIIHNVNDGADWLNGNGFFVRSKRVKDQYWYANSTGFVETSKNHRTKFVIRAVGMDRDSKEVMIRSDKVTIELAETSSTTNVLFVGITTTNSQLRIQSEPHEWLFGDFFNAFGTEYSSNSADSLVYSSGIADDWEPV